MATILHIETATDVCSVAMSNSGILLGARNGAAPRMHSSHLTVFIQELMEELSIEPSALSAISVSQGPGSYTGLRIGVSVAKGLAFSLQVPLISVPTLQSFATAAIGPFPHVPLLCPMIDARRMEIYFALFDRQLNFVLETVAEVIEQNSFETWLQKEQILFFGDGMLKCREILGQYENALFWDDFSPQATHQIKLGHQKFEQRYFENVAEFEPFYLKDFVANNPSRKWQNVLRGE